MLKRVSSIFVGLINQKSKNTRKQGLEIGAVEENINLFPSALWGIHESSQNTDISNNN